MRVTPGMSADNALYNLQHGRSKLDKLQELAATGVNINRPSDDPISTRQLLDLQNSVAEGDQYLSNIQKGNLWLNVTNTALGGMSSFISQARKVAGSIANGSSDLQIRKIAIDQITQLRGQLIDLGNTQIGDQYIFGGYKNNQPPFDRTTGAFSGTDDAIDIEISQTSKVALNLSGGEVLQGTGGYGSVDIIGTLDTLMTAINANNIPGIQAAAASLDSSSNQINNAISDVAGRMTRLDNAKTMITSNKNTLQGIIADKQNVDYAKVATELSQQQTAFQAALSATAKISQLSLLDYIQ